MFVLQVPVVVVVVPLTVVCQRVVVLSEWLWVELAY